MSTPHHCRYATVGSKSDSEVGFWTGSDVQIWDSVLTGISLLVNKEQINAFTNLAHQTAIIHIVFKVGTHELIPDAWVSYVKPSCYDCSLL